jgi:signal recognition particle receptor subunit beta
MSNSLEAKIVVLGSQGVGKTSLVHRYVKNAFAPPTTQSTIGASFVTKKVVDIDTSTTVRLQIWDTAGQERFRSISKLYYRGKSPALTHSHTHTRTHAHTKTRTTLLTPARQAPMQAFFAMTSQIPRRSTKWAAGSRS